MATATQSVTLPLTGEEIRKGIAARISADMPTEHAEAIRTIVYDGLGKTCSLEASTAYAKFNAKWSVQIAREIDRFEIGWWVDYELDDFGRITKSGIGQNGIFMDGDVVTSWTGTIDETPPDRFRRETSQPIPKPVELKKEESGQTTFSKAVRRGRPRRQV